MTVPLPDQPAVTPEIIASSFITPEDVERARLAWEADAPSEFRHLLDADIQDEDPADG